MPKTLTPAKKAFRKFKEETAQTVKVRIQSLLRAIAIERDKECVLTPFQGKNSIPYCNGYRNDGELVLQYDHLNSRAFNVSFADPRLGVLVCKGHHGWKSFGDNNKKLYDKLIRNIIGTARADLWDKVEQDRRTYPMGRADWLVIEISLRAELNKLKQDA